MFTGLGAMPLADLIRLNYAQPLQPMQIRFKGDPLHLSDADALIEGYREIFRGGIYRFHSRTERPLIIDAGANVGLATIFFKQLYPASRVILFEPDAEIFKLLKLNLQARQLGDVEPINAAVWISDGSLSFTSEGGLSGHISSLAEESAGQRSVKSVRLKRYLDQDVGFLKLDIEGAEYEVLEDCRGELKNVENLFVEYHSPAGSEQRLARILEILSAAGFRYHIHEAFTSPRPFLRQDLLGRMDLQLNIFGVRPA